MRRVYEVKSEIICVRLPKGLVREMDKLIQAGLYQNRADLIREAMRRLITTYKIGGNGSLTG